MTPRYQVMIVTSILIFRKAKALRIVTVLKEGNIMTTLKPNGKHYNAFKIQTNVTTQRRTSDTLNSTCRCEEFPPYL